MIDLTAKSLQRPLNDSKILLEPLLLRKIPLTKERSTFYIISHLFYRNFGKQFLLLPIFIDNIGLISGLAIYLIVFVLSFIKSEVQIKTALSTRCFTMVELVGRSFSKLHLYYYQLFEFFAIIMDYYQIVFQIDCFIYLYFDLDVFYRTIVKVCLSNFVVVENFLDMACNMILFLNLKIQNKIDKFIEMYWLVIATVFFVEVIDVNPADQSIANQKLFELNVSFLDYLKQKIEI